MPSPTAMIRRAGARRAQNLHRADVELNRIAGVLLDQGDDANVAEAAEVTGIARTTLYRRMEEVRAKRIDAARRERALLPNLGNPDAPAPQPADTDR